HRHPRADAARRPRRGAGNRLHPPRLRNLTATTKRKERAMPSPKKYLKGALATAAALALLAGCASGTPGDSSDEGLTKLNVSPVVIGPTYWPFYFTPQALGYYEDEGLDVEIMPLNAGVTQALLTDQIQIGGAGFEVIQQATEFDNLA